MFIHLITFSIDEGKLQGKIDKAADIVRDFKTPLRTNRPKCNKDNGRLEQHFNPTWPT